MSYVTTDVFNGEISPREVYEQFFDTSETAILSWVWNEDFSHKRLAWVTDIADDGYTARIIPDITAIKRAHDPVFFKKALPIDETEARILKMKVIAPNRLTGVSLFSTLFSIGLVCFGIYITAIPYIDALPYFAVAGTILLCLPFIIHGIWRTYVDKY